MQIDIFDMLEFIIIVRKLSKGVWRMPWLSEAMKDVTSCDKLRVGANNSSIRRFPNGATQHIEDMLPS